MKDKFTKNIANQQHLIHQLPAGTMPDDQATEIFACRTSRAVYAISKGNTIPFQKLPPIMRSQIFERLLDDELAMNDLKHLDQDKAVEQFAFCIFGAADSEADFCPDGNLKESDNFICSNNCQCLNWKSKKITVDGIQITHRQLQIAQRLATDKPDKQIADELGICVSTLDTHKKAFFEKFNVHSKTALVMKFIENKIIQ